MRAPGSAESRSWAAFCSEWLAGRGWLEVEVHFPPDKGQFRDSAGCPNSMRRFGVLVLLHKLLYPCLLYTSRCV